MIITKILTVLLNLLTSFLAPINIPGLGDGFLRNFDQVISLIFSLSEGMIGLFLPWTIVKVLLPIVIAIIFAEDIYKFVMWILRKIPFLGIK